MTTPNRATAAAASRAAAAAAQDPAQYLTFMLGGEMFAIGIPSIREIIEYHGVTEVPMMPPAVRGVINLRGAAVPVMDLHARFGRPSSAVSKKTCVVIVEIAGGGDERHVLGVMVDAVNEVLDLPAADIEPAPGFGANMRADFLQGMGKVRGRFVMLLDLRRVLSPELAGGLQQLTAPAVH